MKPLGVETLLHYTENHQSSGHLSITRVPGITMERRQETITRMAECGVATNVQIDQGTLERRCKT